MALSSKFLIDVTKGESVRSLEQIRNLVAGLLVAAVCSSPVFAGDKYYRWVDEQGTEVNSDQPPPAGTEYEVIQVKRSMTVPVTEDETAATEGDDRTPTPQRAAASPSAPRMVMEKNPEACAAARKNLETLNTYARIRVADSDGSYHFLDEDEKSQRRAEAEAAIAATCE